MNTMTHKDVYIRIAAPNGKAKDVINHHRVWDAERFFSAQQEQHNGPKVKTEDRRIVSLATKKEYDAQRKAVHA
ncbi:MAG: hypothetical protein ACYC0P_06730 [Thiobacillus sp.]